MTIEVPCLPGMDLYMLEYSARNDCYVIPAYDLYNVSSVSLNRDGKTSLVIRSWIKGPHGWKWTLDITGYIDGEEIGRRYFLSRRDREEYAMARGKKLKDWRKTE